MTTTTGPSAPDRQPLDRELAAIRCRAENRATVPARDALRLLNAVESLLAYAAGNAFTFTTAGDRPHTRDHPFGRCDCPGAIAILRALDPDVIRDLAGWRILEGAATAAGDPA